MPAKGLLIKDVQHIRHMIVLADRVFLARFQFQKDIARKQRFAKHDRFPAVLVRRLKAGQGRRKTLALTVFDQFLFPARPHVGHVP